MRRHQPPRSDWSVASLDRSSRRGERYGERKYLQLPVGRAGWSTRPCVQPPRRLHTAGNLADSTPGRPTLPDSGRAKAPAHPGVGRRLCRGGTTRADPPLCRATGGSSAGAAPGQLAGGRGGPGGRRHRRSGQRSGSRPSSSDQLNRVAVRHRSEHVGRLFAGAQERPTSALPGRSVTSAA